MGKQIIFYMDEKVESEFLLFLQACKYSFVVRDSKHDSINIYDSYEDIIEGAYIIYLYQKMYGEVHIKNKKYVDTFQSPIIEYSRCVINDSEKSVSSGRLWISTDTQCFTDPSYKEMFLKDYSKLVRWIKKHVPYQTMLYSGKPYKEYINQTIRELYDAGYKLC